MRIIYRALFFYVFVKNGFFKGEKNYSFKGIFQCEKNRGFFFDTRHSLRDAIGENVQRARLLSTDIPVLSELRPKCQILDELRLRYFHRVGELRP